MDNIYNLNINGISTRAGNRQALVERFRQTQPGQLADRVAAIIEFIK